MAENIMKSADRRLYSKTHGDGEDPIIIAQRFLNIFRQLHIFTSERKNAFNNMILEQPSEIRGMFSSLPGGSLLQEYVDELEEKSGIIRDPLVAIAQNPELSDEISKAKILATALAEAQIQASAKLQQAAPIAPFIAPIAQGDGQSNASFGSAKIVADASFAKEIGAAFVQAIKYSEETRKSETKEIANAILSSQEKFETSRKQETREIAAAIIASQEKMAKTFSQQVSMRSSDLEQAPRTTAPRTSSENAMNNEEILQAITESQNKMAQMIMQHNTVATSANTSSNNNANNIQINTTPMPPMEDIVRGIVKAQSELFREMSETQTKELSAIISVALKESQQLSSQAIIEAITALQKENLKFFERQASRAPLYTHQQKIPEREAGEFIYETKYHETKKAEPEQGEPAKKFWDFSTKIKGKRESEPEIADIELPETKEFFATEEIDEDNFADEEANDILSQLSSDDTFAQDDKPKKKKKKKKKNKNKDAFEFLSEQENRKDENVIAGSGGLDISLFDIGDSESTHQKKTSSLESSLGDLDKLELTDEKAEDDAEFDLKDLNLGSDEKTTEEEEEGEWVWEEVVEGEEDKVEATSEEEEGEWVWEEVVEGEEGKVEATSEEEEGEWVWEETEEAVDSPAPIIAGSNQIIDVEFEPINTEKTVDEPIAVSTVLDDNNIEEDDLNFDNILGDEKLSEQIVTPQEEIIEPVTAQAESKDEWEWEYEEVPSEEPLSLPEKEPKIELEAEVEEDIIEPVTAQAESEDEWEWEYEEVPSEEPLSLLENEPKIELEAEVEENIIEPITAQAECEDEWEWEYEEVPSEEPLSLPENEPKIELEAEVEENIIESAPDEDITAFGILENPEIEDIFAEPHGSVNPLHNGDLYFQDDVYKNLKASTPETLIPIPDVSLGIADISDENDKKEPYVSKDDIIG